MQRYLTYQYGRWSLFVLVLGILGCQGANVVPQLTPEQLAAFNVTQDQVSQWNANNVANTNPEVIASLAIIGCGP
ncbi:hypothetical protein ELY21_00280 [Legionella sp. km535]|uniref:hypothetical protein n=1 Tax=Legionella sp. km535 TaxID=2498107 RepID=UPI000F8E8578|nr:hypothetical protein [Legionella sp. km535]RUR20561.1 hypothetical protein ELY21_00280 [Legionella sp. km535]